MVTRPATGPTGGARCGNVDDALRWDVPLLWVSGRPRELHSVAPGSRVHAAAYLEGAHGGQRRGDGHELTTMRQTEFPKSNVCRAIIASVIGSMPGASAAMKGTRDQPEPYLHRRGLLRRWAPRRHVVGEAGKAEVNVAAGAVDDAGPFLSMPQPVLQPFEHYANSATSSYPFAGLSLGFRCKRDMAAPADGPQVAEIITTTSVQV